MPRIRPLSHPAASHNAVPRLAVTQLPAEGFLSIPLKGACAVVVAVDVDEAVSCSSALWRR